jgi:hypothetical protein
MMEANQMLLGAVQWDRFHTFPQTKEFPPKIEEFHMTTAKTDTA